MSKFKAYNVGCVSGCDFAYCDMIFAHTANEARRLASTHCGDWGYMDLRAIRVPDADQFLDPTKTAPHEPSDKAKRAAGWMQEEGDTACVHCGLYSMGLKEFEICDCCEACKECGCSDDCKTECEGCQIADGCNAKL